MKVVMWFLECSEWLLGCCYVISREFGVVARVVLCGFLECSIWLLLSWVFAMLLLCATHFIACIIMFQIDGHYNFASKMY